MMKEYSVNKFTWSDTWNIWYYPARSEEYDIYGEFSTREQAEKALLQVQEGKIKLRHNMTDKDIA